MQEFIEKLSIFPSRYFSGLFRRLDCSIWLILFTFLRLKRPLRWGKDIYPLNFSLLRELVRGKFYQQELTRKAEGPAFYFHQWQLISPVNSREQKLLDVALEWWVPREVAQIVIRCKSGAIFESTILRGGFFSCSSFQKVDLFLVGMLKQFNLLKSDISKIEILHTHPSIDFILETTKQQSFLYLNALSPSDLAFAQLLSKNFETLVTIKALTHSALAFSVSYIKGKVLDY